jgi:phosphate transport system substrate-binding protein
LFFIKNNKKPNEPLRSLYKTSGDQKMKKCSKHIVAILLFLAVSLVSVSVVYAVFVLNVSCSSQIAEAFGREALEEFMVSSGVKVKIHVFSSEKSIDRLKNGFCNFAGSTVKLSRKDKASGLIEIPICKDPLVVITNSRCEVKNLTLENVQRIFSGYIKNWKELGGKDQPIVLIIPGEQTGAYKNFKEMAMGAFEIKNDMIASKSFKAITGVKNIPGSISFIANGIAIQYKDVSVMSLDGVKPSDSAYPFYQTFSMVIKGEPKHAMKETIKYMISDKAVLRMKKRGMRPILQ